MDTFFEFGMVENFNTSDVFGCMSLWPWLCSEWRPITTSGFVRHLENVQVPLFILLPGHLTILVSNIEQESRAVARKQRDAVEVLFSLKFADNIH